MPELKKYNVDSFNMDHTKVTAPYVRLSSRKAGKHGDVVTKFDIRVTQPNKEFMPTGVVHTIEHIFAECAHEFTDVIDFSPMGCRTGFYLTLFGDFDEDEVARRVFQIMQRISLWDKEIPAANEIQCGNYKDMDLDGARRFAKAWIDGVNAKGWKCCKE